VLARSGSEMATTVAMIEQAGGRAQAFAMDVTDATAVRTTMAAIERSLGPVDLLVNNAATLGPIGPFCDADAGEWWHAMDVNLRGPVLCTRAVLPAMISRHRGRVVSIASSAIPIAYFSSYVTSKTALIRFTETVAAESKPHGVSLFAVGPGTVRTAMSEHSLNSPEGHKWLPWFRRIFDEGLDVPAERPAQLVLELASGRADALSGRFLTVSDNLDVLLGHVKQIEENNLYSLRVRTVDGGTASAQLASIRAEGERAPSLELRLERTFAAPRDKVFHFWIDSEAVKEWFVHQAPVHWRQDPTIDARLGGHYRWNVVSDNNELEVFEFHGTYREIKSAEELTFTWEWQTLPIEGVDGPGNTLVSIEFIQQGDKTKIVLTQTGLPSEAARDAHNKGWQRCFDGIAKLLSWPP
jgi:NAD(P)-dependent dehydrogenase (short-subunit alcohol dehydrogenase family)/uncharacterized protein YndB with AHSA1/START domain